MKLTDYFQPLNVKSISLFILLFIFFDIFGSLVKKYLVKDKKVLGATRLLDWLIGFGPFIFIWFILGFFVAPTQTNLLVSIFLILTISVPSYIKNKNYLFLLYELKHVWPALLFVLPFLPSIFVKASLPPYYGDEMAYHFISPNALIYLLDTLWDFHGGALMNAPRLMDTFFILIFSLTNTYSIVRLFIFTMFSTGLIYTFRFLKQNIGVLTATLFMLIFLSLPQEIVLTATVGYVDIPAYSFLMIGVVSGLSYVLSNKDKSWLIMSVIFWAMSLGSKYTTIPAFFVFMTALMIVNIVKEKKVSLKINFKFTTLLIFLFVVFGGYWYVKNFIIYGNPIYPFLFPCWGEYAGDCQTGSGFFGDWTLDVNFQNLVPIINSLLPGNKLLMYLLPITPLVFLIEKDRNLKTLLFVVAASFSFELLALKLMSGFLVRYHQHMQFFLVLTIVYSVTIFAKYAKIMPFFKFIVISIIVLSTLGGYVGVIVKANSLKTLNWNEINYSVGRDNIYDWIDWRLPSMSHTIYWCEEQDKLVPLTRFDPDMIWYSPEGFMRSFVMHCSFKNAPLEGVPLEDVIDRAVELKLQFYITTINPCIKDSDVKTKRKEEDGGKLYLRRLNNIVVCNSKEIVPNLYYFDYNKVDIVK